MNKRTAAKLAQEDTTPYGVVRQERGHRVLYRVTGYSSAKVIAGKDGTIITESEIKKMSEGS